MKWGSNLFLFFYVYKAQSDLNIQGEQPKQLASLSLGEFVFLQECFLLQFYIFFQPKCLYSNVYLFTLASVLHFIQPKCLSSNVYLFNEVVKSIKLKGSNEGNG